MHIYTQLSLVFLKALLPVTCFRSPLGDGWFLESNCVAKNDHIAPQKNLWRCSPQISLCNGCWIWGRGLGILKCPPNLCPGKYHMVRRQDLGLDVALIERVTGTGTTELLHLRVGSGKNCCIELV